MSRLRVLAPVLLISVLAPGVAVAGEGEETVETAVVTGVTLEASTTSIAYGQGVELSGAVEPAAPDVVVELIDEDGAEVLPATTTDGDGAFSFAYEPAQSIRILARAEEVSSDPIDLAVRPVLTVSLSKVLLFGKAAVSGTIKPALNGEAVTVRLVRKGVTRAQGQAEIQGGGFSLRLPVRKPGTYRAVVSYAGEGYAPAEKKSAKRTTPLPRLGAGSTGVHVELLERRLRQLKYHVPAPDRRFDFRTGDAVLAFHKVQGMTRTKTVRAATWRKLASPRIPKPKRRRGSHIEVDMGRQVLYVVRKGKIAKIVHVSTGLRPGWTRPGTWRVHRKIQGYSPGRLYYPSYFDGNRAVHGWPSVPTYPASHGCVRVPNWTAVWLNKVMPMGSVVRIY